jgi:hypothetical protein
VRVFSAENSQMSARTLDRRDCMLGGQVTGSEHVILSTEPLRIPFPDHLSLSIK